MKITNVRKMELGPTVKGFFSVDFEKFVIHGFKFMQQAGQKMWISPPDEKYTDKDGKTKYKKIVEFADKDYLAKIEAEAIKVYNEN
jgi:DNA-binding cell septation regulator SpoVG